MRLLKNISPTGIKINLSLIDANGQNLSIELIHGEFILVNDSGIETKSVIIQKRKGNIEILESFPEGLVPYKKYLPYEVLTETNLEVHSNLANDEIQIIEDKIPTSMEEITTESETIIIEAPKNKGGRPKGSFKKNKSIRKKKNSKSKKNKTSSNTNNIEL